jgi:NAD(P)-dependent dehydrogenase (short-subunit alcohol dehydrogenase family)
MTALVTDRFADRIALVTGAANGIGRASALRLAREGADLVVVDREGDTLQGVAREIEEAGRRVLPITADWTDPGAVEAAFAAIRQRFGRIDILFNNAGAAEPLGSDPFDLALAVGRPERKMRVQSGRQSLFAPRSAGSHPQRSDEWRY